MLARSVASLTGHPFRAARLSVDLLRSLPTIATTAGRPRIPLLDRWLRPGSEDMLTTPSLRPPRTPFNRPISPHRRWAFRTLPLAEVKRVKSATGSTVNDVVMALCTGALRQWLSDHDALPTSPLVAAVPVSIRSDNEKGTHGNRVSSMLARCRPTSRIRSTGWPLSRGDARRQGAARRAARRPAGRRHRVRDAGTGRAGGPAGRPVRIVERIAPFNLIISNVPGPNVPLYYAGAELLSYYPLSAIADGQGLNITVMSYRDGMYLGLIACRELVPDLDDMARHMVTELAKLTAAIDAPPSQGKASATTPRRRTGAPVRALR